MSNQISLTEPETDADPMTATEQVNGQDEGTNAPDDVLFAGAECTILEDDPAGPAFDADALVRYAEEFFNVQEGTVGEKREPMLNNLHTLFVYLIEAGATATVRDRVMNQVIIEHYGKEYGGTRAMTSTWNEIAKEIAATRQAEVQAKLEEPELTEEEKDNLRAELWPVVKNLAMDENLLDTMAAKVQERGVVGEHQLVKLLYVTASSRFLDKPVNVVVKGASSGGKSFVVEQVLSLFPDIEMYKLTTSSPLALVYDHRPLAHKIIMVYEATPLQQDDNNNFALLLRTLISEGEIRHQTTVEDPDCPTGRRVELIERKGPISLIITTTAETLHAENETRMLSYRVIETAEQTKAIFQRTASGAEKISVEVDLSEWHDFQGWLQLGPTDAVVPFASAIAVHTPPTMVRFRRDFGALLNLIKAVAIIYQAQRERDDNGCIIAALADYEVARPIFDTVMTQSSGKAPSANVRVVVEQVSGLLDEQDHANGKVQAKKSSKIIRHSVRGQASSITISSRRLGQMIGIDYKAAQRAIKSAVEQGYLVNSATYRGKPYELSLGDRELGDAAAILPTVEELETTLAPGKGSGNA